MAGGGQNSAVNSGWRGGQNSAVNSGWRGDRIHQLIVCGWWGRGTEPVHSDQGWGGEEGAVFNGE